MTLQAQILIVGLLLIVLAIIVNMIRRRRLELRYVLIWMGCDFALIILASFPRGPGRYTGNKISDEYDILPGLFVFTDYYLLSDSDDFPFYGYGP